MNEPTEAVNLGPASVVTCGNHPIGVTEVDTGSFYPPAGLEAED